MPTIAELIQAELDRGASYGDLSRRTRDASGREQLGVQHLQKLVTQPVKEFPKPRTVQLLAELLQVSVTTITLGFARSLGLAVRQGGSLLEVMLPDGTDSLTVQDREAIRAVTVALIEARRQAGLLRPDYSMVQGLRGGPVNGDVPVADPTAGPARDFRP